MTRRKLPSIRQLIDQLNDADSDTDASVNQKDDQQGTSVCLENVNNSSTSTVYENNFQQSNDTNDPDERPWLGQQPGPQTYLSAPFFVPTHTAMQVPSPNTLPMTHTAGMIYRQQPSGQSVAYPPPQNFGASFQHVQSQHSYQRNLGMVPIPPYQFQEQRYLVPNEFNSSSLQSIPSNISAQKTIGDEKLSGTTAITSNLNFGSDSIKPENSSDGDGRSRYDESGYSKRAESVSLHQQQHIPRPRNAFILFRQHWHQKVFNQEKEKIITETNDSTSKLGSFKANSLASRDIGRRWRLLSASDKQYWLDLAKQEKEEHKKKYPDYKYLPTRKNRRNSSCSSRSSPKNSPKNSPKSSPNFIPI